MKTEEAEARAVNAEPWEPLPGMVKRRCKDCRYWFASRGGAVCLGCEIKLKRSDMAVPQADASKGQ